MSSKYGGKHQAERKKWRTAIDQGGIACCLCSEPIHAGEPFDLDHVPGSVTSYRGAAHPRCNRSEGAHRGNQQRAGITRWAL